MGKIHCKKKTKPLKEPSVATVGEPESSLKNLQFLEKNLNYNFLLTITCNFWEKNPQIIFRGCSTITNWKFLTNLWGHCFSEEHWRKTQGSSKNLCHLKAPMRTFSLLCSFLECSHISKLKVLFGNFNFYIVCVLHHKTKSNIRQCKVSLLQPRMSNGCWEIVLLITMPCQIMLYGKYNSFCSPIMKHQCNINNSNINNIIKSCWCSWWMFSPRNQAYCV